MLSIKAATFTARGVEPDMSHWVQVWLKRPTFHVQSDYLVVLFAREEKEDIMTARIAESSHRGIGSLHEPLVSQEEKLVSVDAPVHGSEDSNVSNINVGQDGNARLMIGPIESVLIREEEIISKANSVHSRLD